MNTKLSEQETKMVLEILSECLGVPESQLTPEARIKEDLMGDSLDDVEIVMAVEERFDVTIPDEASERVASVGDLAQLLADLLADKKASA